MLATDFLLGPTPHLSTLMARLPFPPFHFEFSWTTGTFHEPPGLPTAPRPPHGPGPPIFPTGLQSPSGQGLRLPHPCGSGAG